MGVRGGVDLFFVRFTRNRCRFKCVGAVSLIQENHRLLKKMQQQIRAFELWMHGGIFKFCNGNKNYRVGQRPTQV